jgi:hypothetical protein
MAYKSKRLKLCEEEESTDIPTVDKLYKIIQEMALKQQQMEEKMDEMQKWIDKKKKKLNIISWLNTQFKPSLVFENRVKSLIVTEDDINSLIEENFVITVINILKKNLKTEGPVMEPLACFAEKNTVFYIYKPITDANSSEVTQNQCEWFKMSVEEFVYMLRIIHSKILHGLCAWRDKNSDKISQSEKIGDAYNKAVIKLMGADFTQESTLTKIRAPLFNMIKGNLKNMIEYEFEF